MKQEYHIYGFERLEVWKLSIDLVMHVSDIVEDWPMNERFDLTSQISRAATSITCNISEGSGRLTPKDQNKFYTIAYSSSLEVLNCLIISYRKKYTPENSYVKGRHLISRITSSLNKMVKSNYSKIN
ncbi:MAG: four helix bundle protein [Saprospiraceae bacterium]|nr:four helix bundle protein [Saprospiraceae bacterium]